MITTRNIAVEAKDLKGVNIYCADATDKDVLRKADVPNAKSVIIATSSDKVNLLVSQVVRSNFGDKRIVARANSTSNLSAFTEAGIETMSPIQATAAILENMVLRPSLFKLMATKANAEDEHLDEIRVTSENRSATIWRNSVCAVVWSSRSGATANSCRRTARLLLSYNDILTLLGDNKSLERAKRILQVAD